MRHTTIGLAVFGCVAAASPLLVPPSIAATGCSVTVNETDGTIKVSANNTNSTLRWGVAAGAESTVFANAGTCISGSSANNCQLGTSGTLAANTPPAGCTIYLTDSNASCSKWLPRCVPGIRLRDSSFASGDPRIAAVSLEDGGTTLRFSSVNLQIVSGSGATDGTVNGLGNLIVGYNEAGSGSHAGSHNVVLGVENGYASYAGIVTGEDNLLTGRFSSIIGGYNNTAEEYSTVTGGAFNAAIGSADSVSGGLFNTANGIAAAVGGGVNNTAQDIAGWVAGVDSNLANQDSASVMGGIENTASGTNATVIGGSANTASGTNATVDGGDNCTASATGEWLAGPGCDKF